MTDLPPRDRCLRHLVLLLLGADWNPHGLCRGCSYMTAQVTSLISAPRIGDSAHTSSTLWDLVSSCMVPRPVPRTGARLIFSLETGHSVLQVMQSRVFVGVHIVSVTRAVAWLSSGCIGTCLVFKSMYHLKQSCIVR